MAAGSIGPSASSRKRSGQSSAVMMVPISASLIRPLTKLASACLENRRPKPASGEIFESFGLSASSDHTKRCWTMLPPTAASGSSRSGIATAAITSRPSFSAMPTKPRPSMRIAPEWAIRPRSVVARPLAIEPENAIRSSAPAAITNQVLTSWLLTTSPRSSASSSRFWVGSSECSVSSWASAIGPHKTSRIGRELAQRAFDRTEEDAHHGADHQDQNEKADDDRGRQADEEHLHLRHQAREHAEPEVEQEAEHDERCRELNADLEGKRDGRGGVGGDVAQKRNLARLEQGVAVV